MKTTAEYAMQVNAASSLRELCDTLNAIESEIAEAFREDHQLSMTGSPLDITNLPTFGGETPVNTLGIFSWDEGHFLYADGSVWSIENR
jgi:hypothetical protein